MVHEFWDASQSALRGESLLVANDLYEFRISLRSTKGIWRFVSFEISHADRLAGVRVTDAKVEPELLRVRLISPGSRKVEWVVKFARPR